MDDKVQQKISQAASAEYGWKTEEVRVDEVERLRRPSCSFYTAGNSVRPLSYQGNYALLPGSQVVGLGHGETVAKILDTCSSGASADWWAEIITRFHDDIGGGIVLTDDQVRPDIVRKMDKAGMKFMPPSFSHDKQSVSFLLLDPESYILYRIEAKRTAGGDVEVTKTKLLGGMSDAAPSDPVEKVSQMLD